MSNQQIIWRIVNLYPGSEKEKIDRIRLKCSMVIFGNEHQLEDAIVKYFIPSDELGATPLAGTVFIGINKEYQDIIYKILRDDTNIFHQESIPSVDQNVILQLQNKAIVKHNDPLNQFQIGDKVIIVKGDYSGMPGKVVQKHKDSVDVSTWIMGEEQILKVKAGQFDHADGNKISAINSTQNKGTIHHRKIKHMYIKSDNTRKANLTMRNIIGDSGD